VGQQTIAVHVSLLLFVAATTAAAISDFKDQYSVCGACVGSNHRATERALLLAAVWALALASFVLHSNTPTNSNICLGPRSAAAVGDPISISSTP